MAFVQELVFWPDLKQHPIAINLVSLLTLELGLTISKTISKINYLITIHIKNNFQINIT